MLRLAIVLSYPLPDPRLHDELRRMVRICKLHPVVARSFEEGLLRGRRVQDVAAIRLSDRGGCAWLAHVVDREVCGVEEKLRLVLSK